MTQAAQHPTRAELYAALSNEVRFAWPWDASRYQPTTVEAVEDDVQELWKLPGVRDCVMAGLVRL